MPRMIPETTRQECKTLYDSGRNITQIAQDLAISKQSVRRILSEHGINAPVRGTCRRYTDAQVDEVVALYAQRMGAAEIARQVGLRDGTVVYSLLKRRRVTAHSTHGRRVPVGSVKINSEGYAYEKVHSDWPFLTQMGGSGGAGTWVAQHRKVMADFLGRALVTAEQVHHRNGDRADNRLENLQLVTAGHVAGAALCCNKCGSSDIGYTDI